MSEEKRTPRTTAATEASRRTYAKRRVEKAIAEIESQGYEVIIVKRADKA